MKPTIYAVCLLILLVILIVIIDRRDFYPNDDVMLQEETVTVQKPFAATTFNPIGKQAATKSDEAKSMPDAQSATASLAGARPVTEAKTPENPVAETKTDKPTESKPIVETKIEKTKPVAVPVVTEEDARKLNAESLVFFENWSKELERLKRGFILVHSEPFKEYKTVVLSQDLENQLINKDYDLVEFKEREIPNTWSVDYETIPSGSYFQKTDCGFKIASNQGTTRFFAQRLDKMYCSFIFELKVKNDSEHDSELIFGVHNSGNLKKGYKILTSEKLSSKEEKTIEVELSVFEHMFNIAPTISVKGAITVSNFMIYKKNYNDFTTVEGEILERTVLPNPKESDYPNCRFTVHFMGNTIKSGSPCPKETVLIVEGFEDYSVLPYDSIKKGDKVLCTLLPFEKLPDEYQSTQQADDLDLFLVERYYVLDIKTINEYSDNELMQVSGIYFSDGNKDYVSLFERHVNPPVSDYISADQASRINEDKQRMAQLLNGIDDDKMKDVNKRFVEAWSKEKAKDPPNYNRVGKYVWRNLDGSFWTLPQDQVKILSPPNMMSQQMLDCFSSLRQILEANGVQLIVSLVPTMNDISARVINKEFKDIPDIQTATYVKQLLDIGVEAIYASDQIIKNYNRYPFAFFIPENPHPSDTAQDVMAEILAERLKRYDIKTELDPALFSEAQFPHSYKDAEEYWFPENCDIGNNQAGKSYTCRGCLYNGETIKKTKDSPIMVIGNSFIQSPVSPPDSLPAILSCKLRSTIDWYRISGFGPFSDILIQILSNPDFFLKNKKVFIMQVGTMHINNANRSEIMLDIAKLDHERVLLNNRTMKGRLCLPSNVDYDQTVNPKLWGKLSSAEKTVLKIDNTGKLTYNFDLSQAVEELTDSELICVVPHTCTVNSSCRMTINKTSQTMNCFNQGDNARFYNLAYELPPGTKEITIQFEGKPGSFIAINDIQIWQ